MMIGGGSRGTDRSQWNGWGLEEPSKRPVERCHFVHNKKDNIISNNANFNKIKY